MESFLREIVSVTELVVFGQHFGRGARVLDGSAAPVGSAGGHRVPLTSKPTAQRLKSQRLSAKLRGISCAMGPIGWLWWAASPRPAPTKALLMH